MEEEHAVILKHMNVENGEGMMLLREKENSNEED